MTIDLEHWVRWIASGIVFMCSALVSGHALIRKRDPRSALWWVSINLFLPIVGPLLYWFFGINRIERRAARLKRKKDLVPHAYAHETSFLGSVDPNIQGLVTAVNRTVGMPLLNGNRVTPLINGDEAYPEMLKAIQNAQFSIGLSTYIFEPDRAGMQFATALADAVRRNVQVRVLIDDVGAGFYWRSIFRFLKSKNVPVSYFLPTFSPWRMSYFNLRNHRKILTIDGKIAFTGGMNITENNLEALAPREICQDVHFKVEGPVVAEIQDVFRTDWYFTGGENLDGPQWFPELLPVGTVEARAIADGPDEDSGKTRWVILSALAHARKSVRIVTPYLIPDQGLITALNMAALSGVSVEILLPKTADLRVVQWASQALLWQILEKGCRVWTVSPPFNHAKLMMVDGRWSLFGSSNWDVRSFRLNFELNVENYDENLTKKLETHFDALKKNGQEMTLQQVDRRSIPTKLRDGFARLFAPIL